MHRSKCTRIFGNLRTNCMNTCVSREVLAAVFIAVRINKLYNSCCIHTDGLTAV